MGGFTFYGLICACSVPFFSCTNMVYRLEEAQKGNRQTQRTLNNAVSMQLKKKKKKKKNRQTQRTLNNVVLMQLKTQNDVVLGSLVYFCCLILFI
jgi:hypothetical protein